MVVPFLFHYGAAAVRTNPIVSDRLQCRLTLTEALDRLPIPSSKERTLRGNVRISLRRTWSHQSHGSTVAELHLCTYNNPLTTGEDFFRK